MFGNLGESRFEPWFVAFGEIGAPNCCPPSIFSFTKVDSAFEIWSYVKTEAYRQIKRKPEEGTNSTPSSSSGDVKRISRESRRGHLDLCEPAYIAWVTCTLASFFWNAL